MQKVSEPQALAASARYHNRTLCLSLFYSHPDRSNSILIPTAPISDGSRTQPTISTRTKGASCEYDTKVDGSINASAIAALQF